MSVSTKGVIAHSKNNPRTVIIMKIKKVLASMAQLSGNEKRSNIYFSDIFQLSN